MNALALVYDFLYTYNFPNAASVLAAECGIPYNDPSLNLESVSKSVGYNVQSGPGSSLHTVIAGATVPASSPSKSPGGSGSGGEKWQKRGARGEATMCLAKASEANERERSSEYSTGVSASGHHPANAVSQLVASLRVSNLTLPFYRRAGLSSPPPGPRPAGLSPPPSSMPPTPPGDKDKDDKRQPTGGSPPKAGPPKVNRNVRLDISDDSVEDVIPHKASSPTKLEVSRGSKVEQKAQGAKRRCSLRRQPERDELRILDSNVTLLRQFPDVS